MGNDVKRQDTGGSMKVLLAAALVALGWPEVAAAEQKLGAGVTLAEATSISAIVASPKDYAGKTVRIDGVATAVCQAMGCWLAVSESDKQDAPTIRLKVEDDGPIKFPMSAKGKKVSAQGTFDAIGGDAHGKEAASEHAKHDTKASAEYQIAATGAVIR
jgi:hypothetical protein